MEQKNFLQSKTKIIGMKFIKKMNEVKELREAGNLLTERVEAFLNYAFKLNTIGNLSILQIFQWKLHQKCFMMWAYWIELITKVKSSRTTLLLIKDGEEKLKKMKDAIHWT